MIKILVLCTGNSCRSQMAEGFLRHYINKNSIDASVVSAGVETHGLNPRAVLVMGEAGIDISHHTSDLVDQYLGTGITHLFTVCDHAKESCPVFPEQVIQTHHSFSDPAKATGSEDEILSSFRSTRDEIDRFCETYITNLVK